MKLVTFTRAEAAPQASILADGKSAGFGSDMLAVIAAGTLPVPVGASYPSLRVKNRISFVPVIRSLEEASTWWIT